MGFRGWYGRQHTGVQAAVVTGIFGVVVAVVGGGLAIVNAKISNHSPTPEPTSSHSSVTVPPPQPGLRITYPPSGKQVNGRKGVLVKGTASGLASGESGWLFDSNPNYSYFSEDYNPDAGQIPVVTGNYPWSFLDMPIGNPGDKGTTYTLVIVRASSACSKVLAKHAGFRRLPPGCHIDDATDIIVTYPKR